MVLAGGVTLIRMEVTPPPVEVVVVPLLVMGVLVLLVLTTAMWDALHPDKAPNAATATAAEMSLARRLQGELPRACFMGNAADLSTSQPIIMLLTWVGIQLILRACLQIGRASRR